MVIGDRGYNPVEQWMALADRGVGPVIRYNPHGIKLYTPVGQPLVLETEVAATTTDGCWPRAAAQQAGRQIQDCTLPLAAWVLIWTTLPPALLPTATLMGLYRLRWQVELAIKR